MEIVKKSFIWLSFFIIALCGVLVFLDFVAIKYSLQSITGNFGEIDVTPIIIIRVSLSVFIIIVVYLFRETILSFILSKTDTNSTAKDFKHVLLSIQDAVISTDKYGKIKRINKAAEEIIGYKYKEVKDRNIATVLNLFSHKSEKEILYNPVVELFAGHSSNIKYKHLVLRNNFNKTYFVTVNANLVKNSKNKTEGTVLIIRDIAEKSNIIQELNESRNEANILLSNMKEGIFVVNNEGEIIRWSKGSELIFNTQSDEVIGKYVWDIIPEYIIYRNYEFDVQKYKETILDSLSDNTNEFMNKKLYQTIKNPDGKIKNIESYNINYKNNNKYYIASIIRDITEETERKETILKSENKFNKIFELSPIGILIADLYSGKIIDLNQSFERMFEWEKSEIVGKTTLEINFWISNSEKLSYVRNLIKNHEVKDFNVKMKTKKGKDLICSLSGTVINSNERSLVISYLEDITGKVNEEIELQKITAELEEKVKHRTLELELINDNLQEQIFERINTENALRESEAKFRGLIEQLPIGIYRTSTNGSILQTNPAIANILGFDSEEELKSYKFYDFFESRDKRNELYYLEKFAGEIIREETKFVKKDDSIIWVYNNAKAIRDSAGNIIIDGTIEDITYRKHAQAALLESKEKYRKLFDNLSEIYLSINENGNLMEISPSFEKISGFQIKDFLGKNINSILSNDDANNYFVMSYQNIKEPANFIISIKNNQNKICFLSLNLKPNFVGDLLQGFDGIARNISGEIEHNNITETLYAISRAVNSTDSLDELFSNIHKALSNIIDTTNFFFALVDYDNNLIQFPYLVDEVDEPIEAIPYDTPDSYTAKVIMSGEPILRRFEEIEFHNKKDDITGTYSLVWLGVPLKVKEKVIGAIVVQSYKDYFLYNEEDIGLLQSVSDQVALAIERKRNQIALDNQFKFVQNLLEAIPNPVYYKDLKTKKYILCNKAFADHIGYSENLIIGKTISELIDIEYAKEFESYDDTIINQNGIQSYQAVFKSKSGTDFNSIVYRSIFVDSEGNPAGIVGAINDITATKKAEAEIIKALKKEQELGELKSNFISMVSHEYRTPLQAMMMSTELLHDYWEKLNEDSREKQFDRIKNSIKTLNSMLDDVILLNKSERGALVCNPAWTKLSPICESLTREIQFLAKDKCTVDFIIDNPDIKSYIDERLLHLVLTNLLSNAVKYSKINGEVLFHVSVYPDRVDFTVKDCGIGIPEVEHRRLFEPFFRSRNVGTISGTGLGLAIVKDALFAQGGTITYESVENVGTTFFVSIPYKAYEPI